MAPPRRPDPEPLETDDVSVVTIGTGLWGVALVVTIVFRGQLGDEGRTSWAWVCAAGFLLGLLGIRYVRRRRAGIRARADQTADRDVPNPF